MNKGQRTDKAMQKALEVKKFCQDFQKEHIYAPTIREIMDALNISSTSVVRYYLDILVKKGYMVQRRARFAHFMQFTDKE